MWSFIIGGVFITALIITCSILWGRHRDDEDGAFVGLWFMFMAFLIIVLVSIGSNAPTIKIETRTELICVRDNSRISGAFFLFGGYIDSSPCYYYYERQSNGATKLKSVSTEAVSVYEDAPDGTGYLLEAHSSIDPNWAKSRKGWVLYSSAFDKTYETEIHIPKGSITNEFKLDAQ